MKHTIEYDLENPLDAARFELSNNVMSIMSSVTYMQTALDVALETLEKVDPIAEEFVAEVKRLSAELESELRSSESAFWYITHDGICDECIEKDGEKE